MINQRMLRHVKVTVHQRDSRLKSFIGYHATPNLNIKDGFLTIDKDLTGIGEWIINMSEVKFIDVEFIYQEQSSLAEVLNNRLRDAR